MKSRRARGTRERRRERGGGGRETFPRPLAASRSLARSRAARGTDDNVKFIGEGIALSVLLPGVVCVFTWGVGVVLIVSKTTVFSS